MATNDKSLSSGHRVRLREKFLATGLVDYELLELILTALIPRIDVKPIARTLLKTFGGLHQVFSAPIDALIKIPGIGKNTATYIHAINAVIMKNYEWQMRDAPIFHEHKILENWAKNLLATKTTEEFHVLYLDAKYKLLRDELHSAGTTNWSAVYPREILHTALNLGAGAVALLHNHPNGMCNFSTDDIKMTTEIIHILAAAGIQFYDHYLVASGLVISAKAANLV